MTDTVNHRREIGRVDRIDRAGSASAGGGTGGPVLAVVVAQGGIAQFEGFTTAIRIALRKLDGVKDAKVSFADKQAVVEYAPSKVTPERLADAVNKLGYKASLPAKGF